MKPFFIVILLGTCLSVLAQTKTKEEAQLKHFEIGIDATSFVENFISFGSEVNTLSPFAFHFKLIKKNRGLRVFAGFNARTAQSNNNGFVESSNFVSNLKLGYEQRTLVSKRWMVLYGVDALINYTFSQNLSISFEQVTIKNKRIGGGLSPFIGFAFNITPKIYLSTEAAVNTLYTFIINETIFDDPLVPNQKADSNLFRLSTTLPTNLNFTVKF